jgi:hypothetical protein
MSDAAPYILLIEDNEQDEVLTIKALQKKSCPQ